MDAKNPKTPRMPPVSEFIFYMRYTFYLRKKRTSAHIIIMLHKKAKRIAREGRMQITRGSSGVTMGRVG